MKQIQPVQIWYNGTLIPAIVYNLISTEDNLSTSATFYYQLFSANNTQLVNGILEMTGADYITYSSSLSSNDYAYSWGAAQLNLTLV